MLDSSSWNEAMLEQWRHRPTMETVLSVLSHRPCHCVRRRVLIQRITHHKVWPSGASIAQHIADEISRAECPGSGKRFTGRVAGGGSGQQCGARGSGQIRTT